jgi:uncharacterized paraquat-inducible protein A
MLQKLSFRNKISSIFTLISLGLLIPGILLPALTVKAGAVAPFIGYVEVLNETRSILGTSLHLITHDNALVGFLIILFGVIIPLIKSTVSFLLIFGAPLPVKKWWLKFLNIIGKWSMADVFTMSIVVAFMYAKAGSGSISAQLHLGFYFFLFYCLTSLAGIVLLDVSDDNT